MKEKTNAEHLYQETDRAEQERMEDALRARIIIERQASSLDYDIEPESSSFPMATLTSKNKREYQEDKAGAHRIKIKCPTNVIEAEEVICEVVKTLAQRTHDNIPGSTLVFSMSWLDDSNITHVITANVGDSRALICRTGLESTEEALTRLTCEHSLDRPHELAQRKITLEKINDTETRIFLEGKFVARQMRGKSGTHIYPFMDTKMGLAMTRSLGDGRLHHCPIFSREPSISLISLEIQEDIYLITVSDGITGVMSDEEVAAFIISGEEEKTYQDAAKAIAKKARSHGASDNLSVVLTGLHNLKQGEVSLQFVADGHGGSQTSQYIADNIENIFRDVMAKKILKKHAQASLTLSDDVAQEPSQKKSCQQTQSVQPPSKN